MSSSVETFYEVMRRQGITRRSFLKYCSLTAAALGLGPAYANKIAHAMETKPRTPVIWLHGLEFCGPAIFAILAIRYLGLLGSSLNGNVIDREGKVYGKVSRTVGKADLWGFF